MITAYLELVSESEHRFGDSSHQAGLSCQNGMTDPGGSPLPNAA